EADKTPELQKVVQSSLDANTGALQQAVGVSFDGTQADRFQQLWKGYTDDLAAYANSAATGNSAGAQEARTALLDSCKDWGAFLAEASGGQVQAAEATKTAQARVTE